MVKNFYRISGYITKFTVTYTEDKNVSAATVSGKIRGKNDWFLNYTSNDGGSSLNIIKMIIIFN